MHVTALFEAPFATHVPALHQSTLAQSPSPTHDVAHALPPQAKGAHAVVVVARHAPLPLQTWPFSCVLAVQLWPGHSRSGSVPSVIAPQTPSPPLPFLNAEHATQAPVHAVEQQTPSVQNPLAHSWVARHATPALFCETHLPPGLGQKLPRPQSASDSHVPLHALPVALHVEGAHDEVAGRHDPAPLHVLVVNVATVHDEPGQSPSGSVASIVAVHDPFVPGTPDFDAAHAWHGPSQAALQQNPSTQNPVEH